MGGSRALVALGGTLLLASCSLTLFDYSNIVTKKYALVYGVTRYTMSVPAGSYPNLDFPDSDASAVAAMLSAKGYTVKSRWVDSLGDEYVDGAPTGLNIGTNSSAAPSTANITADINSLQATMGPNDIVVFYFSGHGMQDTSVSPPLEYFVPEGGVVFSGGQWGGDPSLSIVDTRFGAMLSVLNTKRKVVILDTCNSGGFIGNSLEVDGTPQASYGSSGGISPQTLIQAISNYVSFPSSDSLSPYGGAMVLSAAGRDESCYESADPPYYHGVMTYYLLQAPQSGDLNHDGHVTVAEAFSLVKAGIDTEWNPAAAPAGQGFEPRISGGPVDFVLW